MSSQEFQRLLGGTKTSSKSMPRLSSNRAFNIQMLPIFLELILILIPGYFFGLSDNLYSPVSEKAPYRRASLNVSPPCRACGSDRTRPPSYSESSVGVGYDLLPKQVTEKISPTGCDIGASNVFHTST
ncbi:hypothetical protein GYMLUDRAFT_58592 [Collybiopsis luxurians FD-317 M1]|uniref:Uncharacterized protein n=1 Tax=Collybiopsis luxurians FD-317 M1 TaxID=944289 RepID=A0A0D0BE73_9AGAR|nr:hypothetical protein GYMLUDRAFT_58592 [Collybiopsis luxurians FD-317 M1]